MSRAKQYNASNKNSLCSLIEMRNKRGAYLIQVLPERGVLRRAYLGKELTERLNMIAQRSSPQNNGRYMHLDDRIAQTVYKSIKFEDFENRRLSKEKFSKLPKTSQEVIAKYYWQLKDIPIVSWETRLPESRVADILDRETNEVFELVDFP